MSQNYPENDKPEMMRFFRRNYLIHCIEGGIFIGGIHFVSSNTVLPSIIKSFGGPSWLISVMPVIWMAGFVIPSLFTAHIVERLSRLKSLVLITGVLMRLPYLAAAFALMYFAGEFPFAVLAVVALVPLFAGFFGGFGFTAWMGLVVKTIPTHRLSSVWAIRYIISSIIGMLAGGIIATVLARYPGPYGYGILHLITFSFLILSFLIFVFIRETNIPPPNRGKSTGLTENLKMIPSLIKNDPQLRNLLITRVLTNGIFIMMPFFAIHALEVMERTQSYLGFILTAQMVGGIIGNILAGFIGDRYGGKKTMTIGLISMVIMCVLAGIARTEWEFLTVFFLLGFSFFFNMVGKPTLSVEICPVEKRATYIAVLGFSELPGMVSAAIICTITWDLTKNFTLLSCISAIIISISLYYLARVKEPRTRLKSRTL